jgi:ATP-dependent DNA ligase
MFDSDSGKQHMDSMTPSLETGFVRPQLASALSEKASFEDFYRDAGRWVVEEKYDGHRLIVHVDCKRITRAWARSGIVRLLPPHIVNRTQYLAPGVYDGELFVPGRTSTDVTADKYRAKLELVLFDLVMLYAPEDVGRTNADGYRDATPLSLQSRRFLLELAVSKVPTDQIVYIAPRYPLSLETINTFWRDGREGAIIKDQTQPYTEGKRVKHWVKFKKEQSAGIIVTNFLPGELGPYSRIVGYVSGTGVGVKVKTLNDEWRATLAHEQPTDGQPHPRIGRTLVISYQDKTPDGRYRHPRADHWLDEQDSHDRRH